MVVGRGIGSHTVIPSLSQDPPAKPVPGGRAARGGHALRVGALAALRMTVCRRRASC